MRAATLITLLLLPCPVWAVLGQQSKGITVSVQGGESAYTPHRNNEKPPQGLDE